MLAGGVLAQLDQGVAGRQVRGHVGGEPGLLVSAGVTDLVRSMRAAKVKSYAARTLGDISTDDRDLLERAETHLVGSDSALAATLPVPDVEERGA